MKGWQRCIPRNYSGELAICGLESCDHEMRIISSLKCQCLVLSHDSKSNNFCSWQTTCKSSTEHRMERGLDALHTLVAAHCQCKSTPLSDVDRVLRLSIGVRLPWKWMCGSPAMCWGESQSPSVFLNTCCSHSSWDAKGHSSIVRRIHCPRDHKSRLAM